MSRTNTPQRALLLLGLCLLASLACITAAIFLSTSAASTTFTHTLPDSFHGVSPVSDCCAKWDASELSHDSRGWLLDPIAASTRAGISGVATTCKAVHVGQIKPGFIRGNHRHRFCNETLIVWGARTKFRIEDPLVRMGYVEIVVNADEVAVLGGAVGRAHALVNVDEDNFTYFIGCQDALVDGKRSNTDYNVWTNW